MNRHIPEDPRLWSAAIIPTAGTRRRTYCKTMSSVSGTPGLTHSGDVFQGDDLSRFAWCPRCVLKWAHELPLYVFPDTHLGKMMQQEMMNTEVYSSFAPWLKQYGVKGIAVDYRAR